MKLVYLFIGFTGIVVGLVSLMPWAAWWVARYGVRRSNKLQV